MVCLLKLIVSSSLLEAIIYFFKRQRGSPWPLRTFIIHFPSHNCEQCFISWLSVDSQKWISGNVTGLTGTFTVLWAGHWLSFSSLVIITRMLYGHVTGHCRYSSAHKNNYDLFIGLFSFISSLLSDWERFFALLVLSHYILCLLFDWKLWGSLPLLIPSSNKFSLAG